MVLLLTLVSLLPCSGFGFTVAAGPALHPRQLQENGVPSASTFISRGYQSSIVVGDYLYIDGGEINFSDNGRRRHLPDNNTYSIDLRTSWNNRTVTFTRIAKTAPVMNYVSLWKDPSNTSFYAYGGEQSRALSSAESPRLSPNSIWKFNINGNSGSWSQVSMPSNSIFPSLVRPAAGIGAYGADLGLLLGGYATFRTSLETASYDGFVPVPGLLMYNMTSGVWQNNSATDFSTYGTAMYGQMQYVPDFGERGLFVVVGGETSNLVSWQDRAANLLSFRTVYIYDPSSNSWHNQTTSGSIPDSRDRFCSVGVQGHNGTFEIFIFGGHVSSTEGEPQASASEADRARNLALDEVFVLTLPGFNWQKANYTPIHPRVNHACNLVGKRQMVVIGGLNPTSSNMSTMVSTPDIWTNGIGIFDLSEMEWKDSYNARADDYITPAAVQGWYQQNGRYPSKWDDPRVRQYFVRDASSNSDSSTNATSSSTPQSSSASSNDKPSNTAAIAGGVVGGVAGLAILGTVLWLFLRYRRRSRQESPPAIENWDGATQGPKTDSYVELATGGGPPPPSYSKPRHQVHEIGNTPVVEAEGNPRYEMHG